MSRHGRCGLSLFIALLVFAAAAWGQGNEPMAVDLSLPANLEPDFTLWRTGEGEAGKSGIVADPAAANGRAIAQLSHDRTDYRFPLAIYKPFTGKDLEVSIRFKAVAGTVDEAGGIAVRLLTLDDYYIAGVNALEDIVGFYRVVKGEHEQLASANIRVSANAWHTLALKAEGDRFAVSFDGKPPLISAQDKRFQTAAKSHCEPRPTA